MLLTTILTLIAQATPPTGGFVLTVTLGDLMQIIAALGAIFIAFHKIQNRLTIIETQVHPVWEWFVQKREREAEYEMIGVDRRRHRP
jgi:hypothetical protein